MAEKKVVIPPGPGSSGPAPRITVYLGPNSLTGHPTREEWAAQMRTLEEMDRTIAQARRAVREEIRQSVEAAQIPERDPALLWLERQLGRETVDRLTADSAVLPANYQNRILDRKTNTVIRTIPERRPNFHLPVAAVVRLFLAAGKTNWTQISKSILIEGDPPKPGTMSREALRERNAPGK